MLLDQLAQAWDATEVIQAGVALVQVLGREPPLESRLQRRNGSIHMPLAQFNAGH